MLNSKSKPESPEQFNVLSLIPRSPVPVTGLRKEGESELKDSPSSSNFDARVDQLRKDSKSRNEIQPNRMKRTLNFLNNWLR